MGVDSEWEDISEEEGGFITEVGWEKELDWVSVRAFGI